ncbi:uncharacterized protein LOC110045060 isoform X3 [Orbicella faveolata]|uniref:uncharacterized protein LOC110045060 isoform X3 n=1 Tax=Orbicella faveolata TaxID=48498 RepID=UPI0009E49863|nr:uncharacterized protein LOC110045060 isoform X3 [Orbicella faveolata]
MCTCVSTSPVKEVYIAVNDTLELNCSINATIHNIHPTQLGWKHHGLILINFTCILNNNTIQLRKNHTQYDDAGVYECGLFNSAKFQSVQKIVVVVGEKPQSISRQQFNVAVYGFPVQEVIVKWPTLQANVTNELFVGRVPADDPFDCVFNSTAQYRRTPEFQNEMLSCHIGTDVLGKLFQGDELWDHCSNPFYTCSVLCVKVVVKNSFGVSESDPARWNLVHETLCPPLRNLTVSFGEHHFTASWQCQQVEMRVDYDVTYVITPVLTGETSPLQTFKARAKNCTEYVFRSTHAIIPFAWYNFTATCSMRFQKGPAVHTEVKSKEAAPSEAPPSCEVKNRSRHKASVYWKLPPISTWNGKPNKFLVYYGDQRVAVNTSLAELLTLPDRSPAPVKLKNLDPGKNYTVSVAMCTAGGCGNMSEPCFILENNEDDSDTIVASVASPDRTGMITGLVIAIGAVAGLLLGVLIWRKR